MTDMPIKGSCHCGAVTFEVGRPDFLVSCNCSICRRYRTLWTHCPPNTGVIHAGDGATLQYVWGDKELAFHSCKTCGCTTHWTGLTNDRFALNLALADPADIEGIRIRHFDGADTWEFLD
ncbi:hypothetical protein [Aliiroseovarius subalbicans]|uniref:GFA family protein n=1 Tax=Aliiroseovarius subalbicans TaxID=2925840 RepID=UPI001F56EAFE|nr:hypothetical protein [Aliiroseovarius subalbicans]MCI2399370.1 hypothetical protein [Aliiroseovarius subalbicans]